MEDRARRVVRTDGEPAHTSWRSRALTVAGDGVGVAELEDATANAVRDRAAQRRAQLAEANRQRQIKEEAARAAEARSTLGRRPVMRPV
eukprot:gene32897-41943_t